FWKQLCGAPIQLQDIKEVDEQLVTALILPLLQTQNEQEFQTLFGSDDDGGNIGSFMLTWPILKSDGSSLFCDCCPTATTTPATTTTSTSSGGVPVRFSECEAYVRALVNVRVGEYREQIEAIRRGIGEIVPLAPLSLLSAAQLEQLVCGVSDIDIPLLRRH